MFRTALAVTALVLGIGSSCAIAGGPAEGRKTFYDIRDYGARPGGESLSTAAIQKAVDAAAAAGGGSVYFPPGVWRSGTVFLKSHVTLFLESGATLAGSTRAEDYPKHRPAVRSYTDYYVCQSLIAGEDLDDVAIRGRGTIDGHGEAFHWKEYLTRPYVIRLVNCRDVLVEGVAMKNSPMWMQLYLACERVMVRGIRVSNHVTYNNDGIDIDGCRDVTISDSIIDSDDDAICLKSTLDRPCDNVTVTNCVLSSACTAIKTGTESNGGFRNFTVANCAIHAPPAPESSIYHGRTAGSGGIAILNVDGGELDRVTISNVVITGVQVPIFLRLGNRARPFVEGGPAPAMGTMKNIVLSNIVATGATQRGCAVVGLPGHPIENITLSNVRVNFAGKGTAQDAARTVPEKPDAYPTAGMFGTQPAYGFYCRHVKNLTLDGLHLDTSEPDQRPALVCDDVEGLQIDSLRALGSSGAASLVRLIDVRQALLRGCVPQGEARAFLRLEGRASRQIVLAASDLRVVPQAAAISPEARPDALSVLECALPGAR